ncbi:MAG: hypothetical protein R3E01_31540 [Pirellulaceae bacterium]|nr:hypothetical protein [Planctomycetales bacterium]
MAEREGSGNLVQTWVVRGLLLVVLLCIAGVFVMDQGADGSATKAYDSLIAVLDEGQSVSDVEVREIVGRAPAVSESGGEKIWIEEYRWPSIIRTHSVKVTYQDIAAKLMTKVELSH